MTPYGWLKYPGSDRSVPPSVQRSVPGVVYYWTPSLFGTAAPRCPAEPHGSFKRLPTPAIDMLASYPWPGNVRELENTLGRAVLMCDGEVVHGHHLPPSLQTAEASGTITRVSLSDAVGAYEKDLLQDALKTTRGNRAKAARLLDTHERIVNYKVKHYGLDARRFKS